MEGSTLQHLGVLGETPPRQPAHPTTWALDYAVALDAGGDRVPPLALEDPADATDGVIAAACLVRAEEVRV